MLDFIRGSQDKRSKAGNLWVSGFTSFIYTERNPISPGNDYYFLPG
jgi:hypothetical protein